MVEKTMVGWLVGKKEDPMHSKWFDRKKDAIKYMKKQKTPTFYQKTKIALVGKVKALS